MSQSGARPVGSTRIADAVTNSWVDRMPVAWQPYLQLSRADRPIGAWLLLLPCWWALWLAILSGHGPVTGYHIWIGIACFFGAFLMRGAGCTWNDITDRDIDGQVERTRARPIPSGRVTVKQALVWMGVQMAVAFLLLLTLGNTAIFLGILSLVTVAIYPFAKRFTWWPQVFLGISFNWGALLAWAAVRGTLEWPAFLLYFSGIAWTLFYDTIYAQQDAEDDALIGVKSTARLFGEAMPLWLRRFVALQCFFMIFACVLALPATAEGLVIALTGVFAMSLHLVWQITQYDPDDKPCLLRLFRSNKIAGLIPVLFFAVACFY